VGCRRDPGTLRLTKANYANKDCVLRHFEVLWKGGQMRASRRRLQFDLAAAFLAVAGVILLICTAPLLGQNVGPDEVVVRSWAYHPPAARIRVQTYEVPVGVVVRDGKGQIVSG
jgi:hypothetical protein